jgi:HlyD family secretion protein
MKRFLIAITSVLLLGGLVALGALSYGKHKANPANEFQMTQVKPGDVVSRISATGTLEPEEVIDVGAQVAGLILSFGKDANGKPIDYGSRVEQGTVLARIDTSLYESDVAQSQAALVQAQANVQRAEADLGQLRAKLEQTDRDWKRAQELGPSNALAQTSYDAYKAAYETAKANLAVGEAVVAQSKGAVIQAQAVLEHAQRNLEYCTIVSPVEGVIIDRRVNIGQTVVSSLNAPSLFLIAKNLKRMQVWVSVNEADIGSIHAGQPVTFTVDALPGQTFSGTVAKIRLNATMTQNVVTYTVEVTADNSKDKLLPYLTANVQFEVARRNNVLTVSNAALHWSPQPEQIAPEYRNDPKGNSEKQKRWGGNAPSEDSATAMSPVRPGLLWLKAENGLRPLRVFAGLSDGSVTEVNGNDLKQGLEVVVGQSRGAVPQPIASTNPFTPQINRGGQRSQGGR